MKKISAKIIGTGSYAPSHVLTNEEIEQTVPGTSAEWTYNTLGIKQRHIAQQDESTATLALEAAKIALRNSGTKPEAVDLIILATTTPRRIAPSTACFVQHGLKAINSAAFDLNAVCSGFIYGMSVGVQFITSGAYQRVLVIGADTFSKITDWSSRNCVFFGDGAGAVVFAPCPEGEGVLSFDLGADGSDGSSWTVLAGGSELPTSEETIKRKLHYWQMDGKAVFQMATNKIPFTLSRSLAKAGLTKEQIDHIIPHQPSIGILKKTSEITGIPFEKFYTNMDRYANTSSATIPMLLAEVQQMGLLRPGEIVAFIAVGAGWTWGSMIVRWAK